MRIALYEPDIPQNTGTILRLAACLGRRGPHHRAGRLSDLGPRVPPRRDGLPRSGVDRAAHAAGPHSRPGGGREGLRLILFTTAAAVSYLDHGYRPDDILMFGRESAGVPDAVHAAADARLVIPMRPGLRSINVAMAAAMALGEAMRQTGGVCHD